MIPVIIPAYKNKEQLEKCIAHLKKQTIDVEIFVRDNTDDNIHFTAAVNEGIRKYLSADCEYIIILNQDMYMEPLAVEKMVEFMDSHDKCGIGTPIQLHNEDHSYAIYAGCYDAFPLGKHQHGPAADFIDEQIYWGNGACMILRKEMIFEIGMLDRNLAFIGSDSDYCFTARSRGWQIWRITAARGIHDHGASKATDDNELEKLKISNMIYFGQKWLTGDLYKALAYEGKGCTPEVVNTIMNQLQEAKEGLAKVTLTQFQPITNTEV